MEPAMLTLRANPCADQLHLRMRSVRLILIVPPFPLEVAEHAF